MTRILVVGAGAIGGYYGARLVQAGRDVSFLVRPGRARALQAGGLRLTGPEPGAEERVEPRVVTADTLGGAGAYDIVLLAVKAGALRAAMDDLAPAVGPGTLLVPCLNGMAHLDALTGRFGDAVLGGVVRAVTTLGPDGEVVRLGPSASMVVGEPAGGVSPRVRAAAGVLDVPGYDLEVSADIRGPMWHKWAFISTVSAVTCLLRGTVGEIVAVPGGAEFGTSVLAEAAAVAAAAGYPLPEQERAAGTATVTRRDSAFGPSIYRDMTAGRPTEVEHVLGDLVARARALGVATPLLDLATAALRVHGNRVGGGTGAGASAGDGTGTGTGTGAGARVTAPRSV